MLGFHSLDLTRLPKTTSLFTDFMESGEGVVQSRENSIITSQPIDNRENSTQDPADNSNGHVDAPANGDEEGIEGEEDEYYGEESIVAYLNTLNDMIIAKNEAPRSGRIPDLKYGNTLFDHQKHAVEAALRSLVGPLKGMILGDPQGWAKACQWMAEIDAFFDAVRLVDKYQGRASVIVMKSVRHVHKPIVCVLEDHFRGSFSPFNLWWYRVAIASYSYHTEEVNRVARFQDAIEVYSADLALLFPKRPKLVLLSGSLESEPWKPIGKCMILDEAHIIKNRNTRTFAAIVGNSKAV
ncbi:CHD3-type chromatin-remodeling factor PICKLE [Fusarium tjaetaba]|uniref:CHD3-type chromatin-remodeling factor PICKLE n=1 Tax=Fusarium tjaetaba TaxID=1567544 RepID=A0A8H5VEL0_9HYPO|nr:CHD3-type chromatin-remodeling factor PICKLE [Fusarium tjaetaba]KAF5619235.1 CHD3-type chromatin-remodeling factor PICKLE [Fusarium tjaetaba]